MYSELKSVLDYIIQQIDKSQIIQLHQQLAQLFEQARSEPSPEVSDNLTKKQEEIKTSQNNIEPYDWDRIKLNIFKEFGAAAVLGTTGSQRLFFELNQRINDPSGASQLTNSFTSEISALKQRAEQTINNLGALVEKPEELQEGKQKIQLVFEDKVAINRLSDLQNHAREWNLILKSLRNMIPNSEEEPQLYKLYKSSPVVIVIIAGIPLIFALAKIVKEVLDIVQKLYDIRETRKNLKVLDLDKEIKEKMLIELDSAEDKKLNQLVNEKVTEVMSDYRKKLNTTQANVADNAARYTIKKIYNFTIQGGNVNLVDGELKNGQETIKQSHFSVIYQKMKKLIESDGEILKLATFTPEETKAHSKKIEDKERRLGNPKKQNPKIIQNRKQ